MFNITPKYINMIKDKKRPFSTFDRTTKQKPNQTFNEQNSKDLTINLNNNEEKSARKSYFNILQKKNYIEQKKLFYNKIYNRNFGYKNNIDFSDYLNVKKEKSQITNIKTKDYTNSRLSSAATYRRINIRKKDFKKNEEFKSYEYNFNKDIKNISKIDKYCEINEKEFKKFDNKDNNDNQKIYEQNTINKKNTINKRGQISISMLLDRKKNIPEKIDIKLEELNTDEMKTKNEFIIKFGNISERFKKILSYSDWFNIDFRTTFMNKTNNLIKKFEMYYLLLLNKITNENCLQSLFEFCEDIIIWQRLVMEEIRSLKKDNIFLNKRKKSLEKRLNIQKKDIKKINEDIIKYDLLKVRKGKKNESKVEKIKRDFISVESNYVNTIYQLQKEKSQLSDLLEINKKEKINNEEIIEKNKKLKEELENSRALIMQKEYNQKKNDRLHSLFIDELSDKINDLEKEKNTFIEKENKLNSEISKLNLKIERMNEIIKEKDIKLEELQKKIDEKNIYSFDENLKKPVNIHFVNEIKFK